MNIIVYDIAALGGGGVTILDQYIEHAKVDKENQWWFIIALSGYEKHETDNVHIVYQKELDVRGLKRWLRRFVFEHRKLSGVVSRIKPDRVLSLQNMMMPKAKCPQTVYLHQSLQFAPVKFSFLKREERSCAFRQRVICRLMKPSLRRADEIIVQTKWMKKATAQWLGTGETKIRVERPGLTRITERRNNQNRRDKRRFFYPAAGNVYKNHRVIIDACKILKQDGYRDYRIEFTLKPDDSGFVKAMYDEVQREQLPISFISFQDKESMNVKYAQQTLLFPSYIETFGLPLQEARGYGAEIIVSDCDFAHEVLEEYDRCKYVPWDDATAWAEAMRNELSHE